ncbi:pentapeptide repeat-containing protein [Microvirga arabica]|uniref:Pentapeptide repeat-containing protein n=1 Tax=Microvirga arabica TaxID=1128671 RepID=A0ABV6Y6S0_9HYPH
MANEEYVNRLKQGVDAWNNWRHTEADPNTFPDLTGANLSGAILAGADLSHAFLAGADLSRTNLSKTNLSEAILTDANLSRANLSEANLSFAILSGAILSGTNLSKVDLSNTLLFDAHIAGANFSGANLAGINLSEVDLFRTNLSGANLSKANLSKANLIEVNLSGANLIEVNLIKANLSRANLREVDLSGANLSWANVSKADLSRANLSWANISEADLSRADLSGANLSEASLVKADLADANITNCRIFGISAWKLKSAGLKQQSLIITDYGEPEITVDNIEVAQFFYLLLHNEKIRDVIDTITSKAVLILGRFTEERKNVLNAIREELRKCDYVPILFDFEKPTSQSLTATVLTLARLSRFIVADLTDPSSIPYELGRIVPNTKVPVQPLLLSAKREFAMFADLHEDYHWVLPIHYYDSLEQLLVDLKERVVGPAERKVLDLRGKAKEAP